MQKRVATCVLLFILLLVLQIDVHSAQRKRSILVRTKLSKELTYSDIVSRGMDVLAVYPDGRADLAVTEDQLRWLESRNAPTSILERADVTEQLVLDKNLGLYHTYDEIRAELGQLAADYPSLTRLDTLGYSIEGRYIIAIKISDNPELDEDEPEVLIVGCHHARELMSVEVPIHTARYLLENYGIEPGVTELVDERETWIAPMINPDGHVYVQENHRDPWYMWWRKNRRDNGDGTFGVDLNRNYGYMWGYDNVGSSGTTSNDLYRGTAPFSEPETQAVRDFCAGRNIVLVASYHSYGELILFPWGYTYDLCDDNDLFTALADSMNSGVDYLSVNGSVLYLSNGGSDDWFYGDTTTKNRVYGYTIELNTYEEGGFGPPEELILPTCERMLDLNLTLIRLADDPSRVMTPRSPFMYDVMLLDPPAYMLTWSESEPGDINGAVAWDLIELKNITSIIDPCEGAEHPWAFDGFTVTTDRAAEGLQSYYSGSGDHMLNTLEMETFYPVSLGDTLRCSLWYDIEEHFDWAYLDASLDQGYSWITVPGNRTTDENLAGKNRGDGITGSSGGWVEAEFYLDVIGLGEEDVVLLRFSYHTDQSMANEGIYIDQIQPVATSESRTLLATACPDTFVSVTPPEPGLYYYASRGIDIDGQRGLWSNVVGHTVTELTPATIPALVTGLTQNYPNPFNPTTNIRFSVGEAESGPGGSAPVLVELYDVAGRRIHTLEKGLRPSGDYSIPWNGTDSRGKQVASGIYFVRLQVGAKVYSRKMVLLR